jgi:hypothetical protein
MRDHEYKRHGTLPLMAGIDLLTGHVHALGKERHRSREFIELIEPWPMRRREREGKAPEWLRGNPGRGLARDMGGMVVEDDLDRGVGGVEKLENLNWRSTVGNFDTLLLCDA